MTVRIRRNGAWINASAIRVRRNGAWTVPSAIRVRRNGAWVTVWPPASAIAVTPKTSTRTAARGATIQQNFTASGAASGTWSFVSGGLGLTITNPNSLTCTVSGSSSVAVERSATLRFSAAGGGFDDAFISWSWGTGA